MSVRDFDFTKKYFDEYLPPRGEGDTLAEQAITALNKLIFKWFNDGDVFDNKMQSAVEGWANDLSSYANWIAKYCGDTASEILHGIRDVKSEEDYEELLQDLAYQICDDYFLDDASDMPASDSIYECDGDFSWSEPDEDEWEDEFASEQPEDFDEEDYEEEEF